MKYKLKTFTTPALVAEPITLDAPQHAVAYLRGIFDTLDGDREHFVVLALNARLKPTGFKVIGSGTQSACLVHARDVFHAAIELRAACIVVAHNHPSGDPSPSLEDRQLTTRLLAAAELLGIQLIDHLVVTAGGQWATVGGLK